MTKAIGLYLHIPFCKRKCAYCDFFSGTGNEAAYDDYCAALKKKISFWGQKANERISSVYFGGGTPSVLGAKRLCCLLDNIKKHFRVESNAEITVEINPESGKTLDFKALKQEGFNRISIGLQSAIAREIQTLGRIHTPDEAAVTVERARQAGFDNISLDVMMGIPFQTQESLKQSIDFCAACGVKHISSYMLKIEENTKFYSVKETLELPDEDEQADLYLFAVNYLEKLGFKQYEISNFAVPGYESRHNTLYWQCGSYIGIGPSAHSFYHGKRFFYERNINSFIADKIIDDGDGGDEEEFVMLSLRLTAGLNFSEFEKKYGHPLPFATRKKISQFAAAGFMECDGASAHFTPKGFLLSNSVISELI